MNPKFKPGDWVRTRAFLWQIIDFRGGKYHAMCYGSILKTSNPWMVTLNYEQADKDCRRLTKEEKAQLI